MTDLWPEDIQSTSIVAPVTMLMEQASILGQRTKNIVTAEVGRVEHSYRLGTFSYDFFITAPALQSYHYRLFEINHSISLYPVTFDLDEDIKKEVYEELALELNEDLIAESEGKFLTLLKMIFGSQKTRKIISALLSQSQAFKDDIPF